jgi:hypothetical protein
VGKHGTPFCFATTHGSFLCCSIFSTTGSTELLTGRGPSGSARSGGPGVGLAAGVAPASGLGLDAAAAGGLGDGEGEGPAAMETTPIAITAARGPLSSGVILVWPPPPARRRSVALRFHCTL